VDLDEVIVDEIVEGLREGLAVGLTSEQLRKSIMDAQRQSGLWKEQRRLVKAYNRHFEVALARAKKLPDPQAICEACGEKNLGGLVPCSICGKKICKLCVIIHYEKRPDCPVPVPIGTCRACGGGI
jgi:hypothetical protein